MSRSALSSTISGVISHLYSFQNPSLSKRVGVSLSFIVWQYPKRQALPVAGDEEGTVPIARRRKR
jgi:hypothetical protein